MVRVLIRIIAVVGFLTALYFYATTKTVGYLFSGLGPVLVFLGTFVKPKSTGGDSSQKVASQKGGAFSTNTQNVTFGNNVNNGKDDKEAK